MSRHNYRMFACNNKKSYITLVKVLGTIPVHWVYICFANQCMFMSNTIKRYVILYYTLILYYY